MKILDSEAPVTGQTGLMPIEVCRQIVADIDADQVTNPERAKEFAERLTACYPGMKPHDAKRYAVALIKVFASYPETICRRVIDPVNGLPGEHVHMPNIANVNLALAAQMKRRDKIRANALAHIQEQTRRARLAEEDAKYKSGDAESRAAFVKSLLSSSVREMP